MLDNFTQVFRKLNNAAIQTSAALDKLYKAMQESEATIQENEYEETIRRVQLNLKCRRCKHYNPHSFYENTAITRCTECKDNICSPD